MLVDVSPIISIAATFIIRLFYAYPLIMLLFLPLIREPPRKKMKSNFHDFGVFLFFPQMDCYYYDCFGLKLEISKNLRLG